MTKFKWTRDGDQHVAKGNLGEYRITEMVLTRGGSNFLVSIKKRDGNRYGIGGFSSLSNAKEAAYNYEGYRASA